MTCDHVQDEQVEVIDGAGRTVGVASRGRVRSENLRHRAVALIVHDGRGRVFVHQRSADKDLWPRAFDPGVGGIVAAGESVAAAAKRELAEELGITGVGLRRRFVHHVDRPDARALLTVYDACWSGPVIVQTSEVAWGMWMGVPVVLARLAALGPGGRTGPHPAVVPDGFGVFRRWIDEGRMGRG